MNLLQALQKAWPSRISVHCSSLQSSSKPGPGTCGASEAIKLGDPVVQVVPGDNDNRGDFIVESGGDFVEESCGDFDTVSLGDVLEEPDVANVELVIQESIRWEAFGVGAR